MFFPKAYRYGKSELNVESFLSELLTVSGLACLCRAAHRHRELLPRRAARVACNIIDGVLDALLDGDLLHLRAVLMVVRSPPQNDGAVYLSLLGGHGKCGTHGCGAI